MTPVSLPVDHWPELDRQRWLAAQTPAGFLELPGKPASHWSPHRRIIVEAAYGRYLASLKRDGALDPSCTPGERATEPRLGAFVTELQAQVAPASASMIVGALLRMLAVLEPERDWNLLSHVYRHLKRTRGTHARQALPHGPRRGPARAGHLADGDLGGRPTAAGA